MILSSRTHPSLPRNHHIRSREDEIQPSTSKPGTLPHALVRCCHCRCSGAVIAFPLEGELKHAFPERENQLRRGTVKAIARGYESATWENDRAGSRRMAFARAARGTEDAEDGATRQAGLNVGRPIQGIEYRRVLSPGNVYANAVRKVFYMRLHYNVLHFISRCEGVLYEV